MRLTRSNSHALSSTTKNNNQTTQLLPRLRASAGKYEPRLDDLPSLENDMQPYVSDTLRSLLFHKDFRKHMEGASMLLDTATQDPPAALSCLDLLLRWIVLRQADTNTQCLLKLLELAKVLLVLLQEQEMELSELELLVLVPCLIEKSGHNQDRIRAMYRDLIQASCCVASVQRVLEMLLVCAQYSKNNRRCVGGGGVCACIILRVCATILCACILYGNGCACILCVGKCVLGWPSYIHALVDKNTHTHKPLKKTQNTHTQSGGGM